MVAAMVSSLPSWNWIDPLPVLENYDMAKDTKRKRTSMAVEDKQLENLF